MAPPPPPPLVDDVTAKILLRLSPDEPEHLFRAALVCKPWLRIICDPGFRRSYRDFHGIPPLLGFLHRLMVFQGCPPARFASTTSMQEMTASIRSPLEDDDLLAEILLRLPPEPSSLPRASAVCYRWLSLVSNASFFRRFRLHHSRNPPLIGLIDTDLYRPRLSFVPAMEAPNRVPVGRFSLQFREREFVKTLSCRHGLVLISLPNRHEVLVWDPVTGEQNRIAVPPGFDMEKTPISGAVLRTTGVVPHFQVVMLGNEEKQDAAPVVRVYSSETGIWSNVISTTLLHKAGDSLVKPEVQSHRRRLSSLFASSPAFSTGMRSALLGNSSLYWLLPIGILAFDLDRQSLAMVPVRGDMRVKSYSDVSLMQAEGGGLGLLTLSDNARAQLWKRETDCDGLASWVLGRTIDLDKLLPLNLDVEVQYLSVVGFVEYNNVVLLWTRNDHFMVQLKSLEVKKLSKDETSGFYHFRPFESVYPADNAGRIDVADLPHNT